jgi:hypothetical protein
MRQPPYGRTAMPHLRAVLPALEISAGTVGVWPPRVPAPPARGISPAEARRGPGVWPGVPRQRAEVALGPSGLLAAVSGTAPGHCRAEPPAAACSGPETASARSCQQQLRFRPKAFRCRGLASGVRSPGSCKQQLSSGASLGSGSTSAPETAAGAILQTTTSWRLGGFCRITEVASCSPPIRSTTCIACTGPSVGPSVRSNATCIGAGAPSRSISTRQRNPPRPAIGKASSIRSSP